VLVGHGFFPDLYVLQSLGFDFETVVGILDTELLARAVFGPSDVRGALRLGDILANLKCRVEGCQVAGNDANFALRVLLLLAAERYSGFEGSLTDNERGRLEKSKAIGHFPFLHLSPS
jgi:hypothetical protein